MIKNLFSSNQIERPSRLVFWVIALALFAGLSLSILSWLEICIQHCSSNQNYRLFGLPFGVAGMLFFLSIFVLHLLSLRYPFLSKIVGILLAIGIGAEIMFIFIQKYQIGRWCPVCLSVALILAIAGLAYASGPIQSFILKIKEGNRSAIMKNIKDMLTSFSFIVLGFLLAFIGVTKINPAEAAQQDMQKEIVFGKPSSQTQIYIFSDWFCGACRRMEPLVEKLMPDLKSDAAFYFIDFPVHRKSLNFTPYNLSFLKNDKQHYFHARQMLFELAEQIEAPTDENVSQAAKAEHLTFKPLSFADVKAGLDYFDSVIKQFDIGATPTVVVTNTKTKKVVKLEGASEINESAILKAIKTVNKK